MLAVVLFVGCLAVCAAALNLGQFVDDAVVVLWAAAAVVWAAAVAVLWAAAVFAVVLAAAVVAVVWAAVDGVWPAAAVECAAVTACLGADPLLLVTPFKSHQQVKRLLLKLVIWVAGSLYHLHL